MAMGYGGIIAKIAPYGNGEYRDGGRAVLTCLPLLAILGVIGC